MIPPEIGQGKPLMRKRVENRYNIQTGVVTEYFWNGQWSETPPEGVDVSNVEEVTENLTQHYITCHQHQKLWKLRNHNQKLLNQINLLN